MAKLKNQAVGQQRADEATKGDFMILFSTPPFCFVLQVITFFTVCRFDSTRRTGDTSFGLQANCRDRDFFDLAFESITKNALKL